MLRRKLALSALVMLSLQGCCSIPSAPPVVTKAPPQSCLQKCGALPVPVDGTDLATRLWEFALVDWGGSCRRLHAECVDWVTAAGTASREVR